MPKITHENKNNKSTLKQNYDPYQDQLKYK